MNTKIIIFFSLACCVISSFFGCRREYDDPDPWKLWTRSEIEQGLAHDGKPYTIVPISTIKQMYYDEWGTSTVGQAVEIRDYYAIEGKVISDDRQNNVARTLYLQDDTGAIEVRLGTYSNHTRYKPGQTVYVLCRDLILGDYRYNLSLGFPAENSTYANGYFISTNAIKNLVLMGPRTKLTSADTTVVTSPDQLDDRLIGRLVRIEGAVSRWGTWSTDVYPSFLEARQTLSQSTVYNNYSFQDVVKDWEKYLGEYAVWEANGKPAGLEPLAPSSPRPGYLYPTLGFKNDAYKYYGSARFEFGAPSDTDPTHNLILRTSGYADFVWTEVPPDGTVVNITALYTKYSSNTGQFIRYQLVMNKGTDLEIVR